jgi:putative transposase
LIAGVYLAGTNTRRVRLALATAFSGSVGKDVVSPTWRKVKGDRDAWNAHLLVDEPVVRLILDGTVARVRLDKKATSLSLLVALGVRADGQKVLLTIETMGGKSEAAWRTLPTISSGADCRRSSSSSMVRQASKRRWWRCGPTRQDHIFVVVPD